MAKGYVGTNITYTPVEYIESTGTQYIDTGIASTSNITLETEIYGNYSNVAWYGGREYINNKFVGLYNYNGRFDWLNNSGSGESITAQTAVATGEWHTISHGRTLIIDGNTITTFNATSFTTNRNITLFAGNAQGEIFSFASIKMKETKLYDGETLVRDFVPALDYNNVACLFDKVENKFYYNGSALNSIPFKTGTAGTPVTTTTSTARKLRKAYIGITDTYTPVEYLESTGTQYIKTGVKPNANIKCIVDFQCTNINNTSQIIIGGWYNSTGMLFGIRYANSVNNFQFAFGTNAWAGNTISADTNRHTLYMNDENGDGRLDNTVLASHTDVISLTSPSEFYLFACLGAVFYPAYCKLYSCKIYDDNTLIRDFIPVIDQNNVACLLDKVENRAYYNSGTGTFSVGNTTGESFTVSHAYNIKKGYVGVSNESAICFEEETYTFLESLQSTGTQYIDTGIKPNANKRFVSTQAQWYTNTQPGCEYSNNYRYRWGTNGTNQLYVGMGSSNLTSSSTYTHFAKYIFDIKSGAIKVYDDNGNTLISSTATASAYANANMPIFGLNRGGTLYYYTLIIYNFKIYDGTTLVRDFVPARRNADGELGMYDKANSVFYTNAGTGTFIAGKELNQGTSNVSNVRGLNNALTNESLNTLEKETPQLNEFLTKESGESGDTIR